ncbi:DNA polymerase III subunit beta [Capnocytophaga sp.]|uniref:DNA polymerase III subunit beta n=1 Tax=Capnocytophaga sp. TaxID=44737 RepID=UPI0026DB711E|nr:DNA polymerase III subunit beta [Capnocytophaga sp.]MDO5104447.1 DNA polymerase III subunit beta [Capnocytophaga sp.]
MKFIVSSSYLLKKLQVIGGVINNSNTMPILDNFLFELSTNVLTISASDLETTVKGTLEVESDSEGSIAVPAKLLIDILKTFAEQPLTFIIKDNNTIEISSTHGKYSLAYLNGEEFPKPVSLTDPNKVTILGDVLATAIQKTIFATGNDDLRPTMSGIFFEFTENGLTFAATDAHKLVTYQREDIKATEPSEFIMPKKPLNLLKGILAGSETEVEVEYNESNAKFSFDGLEFICRLIDGKFPNYDAVIPKENPNKLILNRAQFLGSARRVSIFSNKTTHQIRLKVAGSDLQLSAEDVDYSNKAEERFACNYQGDDMEIGFNSRFLIEMLNNLDSDEVMLEMSMPNRAGILTPIDGLDPGEKVLMLAMPIMLSNSNQSNQNNQS